MIQAIPNPAVDQFDLEVYHGQNEEATANCVIVDLQGKFALQKEIQLHKGYNRYKFDIDRLSNGVYQISLQGININLNTKLIISK